MDHILIYVDPGDTDGVPGVLLRANRRPGIAVYVWLADGQRTAIFEGGSRCGA